MKNIFTYLEASKIASLILITVGLSLSACSESNTGFLDADDSDVLNREKVFSDSTYTYQFQAKIYADLAVTCFADNGWYSGGFWGWSDLSGDSKNRWSGAAQIAHLYNMGQLNDPNNTRYKNHWVSAYGTVYRSNVFLANVEMGTLSRIRKDQLKAEVRFIRAWNYFHLLRLYGGVPILNDKVYGAMDKIDIPRSSFAETVDYIVSELSEVAKILPSSQNNQDYGRITSGAALAAKARVWLFAASPLSNGSIPAETTAEQKLLLGYPSYNIQLWKNAAEAAKVVIDLNRYTLVEDNITAPGYGFYKMQVDRVNSEYIFCLMKNNNRFFEQYLLPSTRGGQIYMSPFQSLVDAFLTDEGKFIDDPTSTYNQLKPYEKRDPRFRYTILHDGAMWIPRSGSTIKERVNLYKGAPTDGFGVSGTMNKTGYAFRKFCDENVSGSSGNNHNVYPIIRYAEVLLNYVEALNEYDPANKSEIESYLIKIRKRAGIKPNADNRYGIPLSYNQHEMRTIIRNERRIELAMEEGHRYFDLKRWAALEMAKNKVSCYGISWSDPKNGTQIPETVFIEEHSFEAPRQYYFPIPLSELNILNMDKPGFIIQNPGW